MKAVINGDRIECGKCGALLLKIIGASGIGMQTPGGEDRHEYKYTSPVYDFSKDLPPQGRPKYEIKCKHKDKGVTCNTINEILL